MPLPIGTVIESDHIDCLHWDHNILLTAKRAGSQWLIKRLDTGGSAVSPALELATWEAGLGDVRAYWAGDDFSLTYSNGVQIPGTRHELPYFSHEKTRAEFWKCSWDAVGKQFLHTLVGTN